ncbi:MAG: hypothetical protein IAG13_27245, partial [Deltaproteobacteria bacterium]|nr:hypothetical protein [Nannocystaceae bacterium]
MTKQVFTRGAALVGVLGSGGCSSVDLPAPPLFEEAGSDDETPQPGSDDGETGGEATQASVTHEFGEGPLKAFEEIEPCVSWTLNNEEPLYVQAVTLSNLSGFHHSNWFVVPDSAYDGPDGYWDCSSRDFDEIAAAQAGTVIFAQSTQSWVETQRTTAGAVIKVPAHSRIVSDVHLLNLAPRAITTNSWMTLELIHPRDVEVVLTPMRLSYLDLTIPAQKRSRHSSSCNMRTYYEGYTGAAYDLKLHYALPHYHSLGDYFDLRMVGGERDGETLYQLEGFNAEANGQTYDPPLDLAQGDGLAFTCGYDNFRSEDVGWGFGDQEMCVMLLLVESQLLMDGSVVSASQFVGQQDDIAEYEGSCLTIGYPKSADQGPPSDGEKNAPLYLPPIAEGDVDVPPVPVCEDVDREAEPLAEHELADIRATLLAPACSFSACHGAGGAAGLDFTTPDLHGELSDHV